MEKYWNQVIELATQYGANLILALITLIIGIPLIKLIIRMISKALERKNIDGTIRPVLLGTISVFLKVSLLLVVVQTLGVKTTSFVAILGAAGLAIALSLKDSLGNFAASLMILSFKPYKVGDYIESQGKAGTVTEVQIFSTTLLTPDNRRIILPNGSVFSNPIINFTAETMRRVDLMFGISYDDDIGKAKEIITQVINSHPKIQKSPEPFLAVKELADSSVNLATRVWSHRDDYWEIFFYLQENVKIAFDENNIEIPFPQRVVHTITETQS